MAIVATLALAWTTGSCPAAGEPAASAGEAIYLRGVLGTGAALQATRVDAGATIEGAGAACVNCHQRSGLGTVEGRILIPPIAGEYLFHARGPRSDENYLPYVPSVRADREPYTEATLARAIREGVDSSGKPLGALMPHFALADADMASLVAYLKSLDIRRMPGASDDVLHFATIITPDADPVKRRGVLDVLEHYFTDANALRFRSNPHLQSSGRTMYSKSMFIANRRWQLHVWELTGPPALWRAQLERHLADEPVLAVISGLGGSQWAPVHDFCERERLPCLFPNVEVPVDAPGGFYSLYLSRGVLLEADLVAQALAPAGQQPPGGELHQVYRVGDSGEAAARALAARLRAQHVVVHDHALPPGAGRASLAQALRAARGARALVLWLRPADLAELGDAPPASTEVFMSGLLGGLEGAPLPAGWRARTRMAYPFDAPARRIVRVDYALGWFSIRRIPVVSQQVQVDTYLACGLLAEAISHMADTFVRPYLIENLQTMLEHRVITGYYPRLSLATGQHFASKGGYLMRFQADEGTSVVADGDWIVPR